MYVVTGATGRVGGAAARALLARGAQVRALVRDRTKAESLALHGAEIVLVDMDDRDALAGSLRGATSAFFMVPPDLCAADLFESRSRAVDGLAAAAIGAGIPHAVLLSGWGAQVENCFGPVRYLRYAERVFRALPLDTTFVRPGGFYENWANVLPAAQHHGVLPSALSLDAKIPQVSAVDIGEVVARSMVEAAKGRRVVELAGPSDYSPRDVAAALGEILHRTVEPLPLPLAELVEILTGMGASRSVATEQSLLIESMNAGRYVWEENGVEFVRGTTTIETGLRNMLGANN